MYTYLLVLRSQRSKLMEWCAPVNRLHDANRTILMPNAEELLHPRQAYIATRGVCKGCRQVHAVRVLGTARTEGAACVKVCSS